MQEKDQITLELHGKILYKVKYKINWSIVIIPDNILIDNYHDKGGHIHHDPKKHEIQEKIKTNDLEEAYKIVHDHVEENKGLKLDQLRKELKE
jgi:hypothetical protein